MEMTHVYVPKEFADQIKAATDDKILQEQVIKDIIQRKYKEIQYEMDILDEQLLQFKLVGVQFEKALTANGDVLI